MPKVGQLTQLGQNPVSPGWKFHSLTGRFQCWTGNFSFFSQASSHYFFITALVLWFCHLSRCKGPALSSALCQAVLGSSPSLCNTGHTQLSQPFLIHPYPSPRLMWCPLFPLLTCSRPQGLGKEWMVAQNPGKGSRGWYSSSPRNFPLCLGAASGVESPCVLLLKVSGRCPTLQREFRQLWEMVHKEQRVVFR